MARIYSLLSNGKEEKGPLFDMKFLLVSVFGHFKIGIYWRRGGIQLTSLGLMVEGKYKKLPPGQKNYFFSSISILSKQEKTWLKNLKNFQKRTPNLLNLVSKNMKKWIQFQYLLISGLLPALPWIEEETLSRTDSRMSRIATVSFPSCPRHREKYILELSMTTLFQLWLLFLLDTWVNFPTETESKIDRTES